MAWWQWIVFGALILGAEALIDADFYLVFIGLAAIAVGLQEFSPLDLPIWSDWLLFATLAAGGIVAFRRRVYALIRGEVSDLEEGVSGQVGVAETAFGPGALGRVELRGTHWSARNTTECEISAHSRVRVEGSEGLMLLVRPEREGAQSDAAHRNQSFQSRTT